jgi:hypothetical protein
MPQSTSNQTSSTAIRFDAAATTRPSQAAARQSARVLIRVPALQSGLSSPTEPELGAGTDTTIREPGSVSIARDSSARDRTARGSRQSKSLQKHNSVQLRIDAAHLEAPSPHSAPNWLKQRANLLGGLLQRKSLLAIGLVMAALVTVTLLLASRPQSVGSKRAKRQPDSQAKVTTPSSSAPTIIHASDAHLPHAPPPPELQQSWAPPPTWNTPAAANLPATLGDTTGRAAIERPISVARREPPAAPARTDLRPASRSGAAAFSGSIERPSPPVSQ